jgi:Protein of unknown function (DUF998)
MDTLHLPATATAKPGVTLSTRSARTSNLCLAMAATFVALLGLLHVVKSELDPSWRFISEYAIGRHGWLMVIAFVTLAVAFVALDRVVQPFLTRWGRRIGRACLYISAAGLTIAAVFVTDPITTSSQDATTVGKLHNLGGGLGLAMPIAAAIIGWKLSRHPAWHRYRIAVRVASLVSVVASAAAAVTIGTMAASHDNTVGPDVLVGWPNRIEILATAGWLIVTATTARRVATSSVVAAG